MKQFRELVKVLQKSGYDPYSIFMQNVFNAAISGDEKTLEQLIFASIASPEFVDDEKLQKIVETVYKRIDIPTKGKD